MRKIIAVVLTVLMIIPLGIVVSSAEATNVARGMTYEFTGAFTDSSSGKVLYPDIDNKQLTDGVKSETMDDFGYSPELWVGLNINGANADKDNSLNYIVVDLGEKKTNLTQFVVYTEEYKGPGILKPKSIEVFVSDDNSNFTSIGKIEEPVKTLDFPGTDNAADGLYKYVLNGNASGRYVKFLIHHGSNWCFVSEVEVYQDPDAEPAPEPVQETITIDGKFDDTGWKASGWTHVDSSNATLYANTEGRDDNFDFQFRADDTYLYVALKSNNKPLGTDEIFGNGKGTMFRLWFFTDGFADGDGNEYTTYNYLIDFRYKNGTLDVEARKNNVYNGNKNEVVTIEGLEAAATSSDSYFYVEAAIPFAKIGATTGTHVFVTYSGPTDIDTTVSGNQPTNGSWTYPEVGTYTDDSGEEKISWAYLKWNTENDLDLVFADIKLGVVTEEEPPVVEDPDPVVDLGPEMEEPAYRLVISTDPAVYKPGDTIKVVVTIKDIAADGGLSLIRFKLYYDKDKVEPVIKGDGDQNKDMFAFLKQAPTNWDDSVCKLNEEEGFYDISFLNSSKTGFAVEDNSLVFEIPFTVKSDATGKFAFYIPHNAPGTNGADSNAKKVYGNGGVVIVAKETSTPSTSSTSSSTTTTVPPTGDTGSLAIAVIAMIALAGAATVAVRKRSR